MYVTMYLFSFSFPSKSAASINKGTRLKNATSHVTTGNRENPGVLFNCEFSVGT